MAFFQAARGGTLIIHGGGKAEDEVARALVRRAGGPDAPILVLAQSNADPAAKAKSSGDWIKDVGAARKVEPGLVAGPGDRAGIDALAKRIREEAGGVWLTGGDQGRFTALFGKTPVPDALRALLERGGAVAGSSAGASLQGEWMPTGDGDRTLLTRDNVQTAPGLKLLPGVLFDTHFLKRERTQRLLGMVLRQPDLLGIGIEETGWVEVDRARGLLTVRSGQVVTIRAAGPVRLSGPLDPRLSSPDVRLRVLAPGETVSLDELRRTRI